MGSWPSRAAACGNCSSRVAPDSLADDHFAEEVQAGVVEAETGSTGTEPEAVSVLPGVAGNAP